VRKNFQTVPYYEATLQVPASGKLTVPIKLSDDLTNFMGIPGQFDHPKFHVAVDSLVKACTKHGKTPGFLAGDEKWARDFRTRGFRMIAYGVDTLLMQRALADGIRLLQGTVKE